MFLALAYAWLRLLLDLVDVRLRVHDPEAELLLLRHQLRVARRQVKRPQVNTSDRTIMAALSVGGHMFIGQADYPGQRLTEPTRSNIPCICSPPRGVI
jgi:hypothetical protein